MKTKKRYIDLTPEEKKIYHNKYYENTKKNDIDKYKERREKNNKLQKKWRDNNL